MNGREAPIGVFDPSFDELTMTQSLVDQLPNEDFVYLGDTARAPYSPRPIAQVREFAIRGLNHLAGRGVEVLVIVYDSASSAVLGDARERYDIPILGVILLAAWHALAASDSSRVGVVCTETTTVSRSCDGASAVTRNVRLIIQACPRFVEFMEAGITGGERLLGMAREYLAPLRAANIDTLILDCIHYPLLTGVVNCVLDDDMVLVSPSDAYTQDTYARLTHKGLLHDAPRHTSRQFLTIDDADSSQGIGERLLGRFVRDVEWVGLR